MADACRVSRTRASAAAVTFRHHRGGEVVDAVAARGYFDRMRAAVPLCALLTSLVAAGCTPAVPVELYVDGFNPEQVSFDVESLGALDDQALREVRRRPDVDGAMVLPPGSCAGPCRAVLVSVFVTNRSATPEPPPVVRLDVPAGKDRRLPIAFSAAAIDPGRVGRVRWLVQLWPEETSLTATMSSSVALDVGYAPTPEHR